MSATMMSVDLSTKRTLNTTVLQKIDKNVLEIMEDVSHAVVYNFANGKWEKGDCEGACFLTRNCMPPYNSVIILNKMGIENFKLDLTDIMNLKLQAPYVMMKYKVSKKAGGTKIVGLWFHDDTERDGLFRVLEEAHQKQQQHVPSQQPKREVNNAEVNTKTGALKGLLFNTKSTGSTNKKNDLASSPSIDISKSIDIGASTCAGSSESKSNSGKKNVKKGKTSLTNTIQTPIVISDEKQVNTNSTNMLKGLLMRSNSEGSCEAKTPIVSDDKAMEELTRNLLKGNKLDDKLFTDRDVSSNTKEYLVKRDFTAPQGVDNKIANEANLSYQQATQDSAKKEAVIPSHHLQPGGVGSAFFFADSPGMEVEAPLKRSSPSISTPTVTGNEATKSTKTLLLKSVLSAGSLDTKSTSPVPPAPASMTTPPLLTHAKSMDALITGMDDVKLVKPLPSRKSTSSFLSPSDLKSMKVTTSKNQ